MHKPIKSHFFSYEIEELAEKIKEAYPIQAELLNRYARIERENEKELVRPLPQGWDAWGCEW